MIEEGLEIEVVLHDRTKKCWPFLVCSFYRPWFWVKVAEIILKTFKYAWHLLTTKRICKKTDVTFFSYVWSWRRTVVPKIVFQPFNHGAIFWSRRLPAVAEPVAGILLCYSYSISVYQGSYIIHTHMYHLNLWECFGANISGYGTFTP